MKNRLLLCTAALAAALAHDAFAGSAAASDQFNAANARLADEARGFAADGRLSSIAEYGRSVLLMMTAAGETYEDERDIDRVFGQNVCTLSDGSSVRIPAEFTLEREEDGVVYLSGIVPGLPDGEPGSQQE